MDFSSGASFATTTAVSEPNLLHLVVSAKPNGSLPRYGSHRVHPATADKRLLPDSSAGLTPAQQTAIDNLSRYLSERVAGLQCGCCCSLHEETADAEEAAGPVQTGTVEEPDENRVPEDILPAFSVGLPEESSVWGSASGTNPEPSGDLTALASQQEDHVKGDYEYALELYKALNGEEAQLV